MEIYYAKVFHMFLTLVDHNIMMECGFAAYFDKQNADNRIAIHRVNCGHHKSHEANDDEWFYDITYLSIRRFAELIAEGRKLNVHDCQHCNPNL